MRTTTRSMIVSTFTKLTCIATLGLLSGFVATPRASALDVFTEPVGFVQIAAQTNSDTYTSVPFTRMPEAQTSVASAAGSVITASGTPGWTASQWVFPATSANDGTVSNTYYVVMTSGARNGAYYTITANTASTLTVSLIPEDLSSIAPGDTFKIIPFWTLNTVWPNGQGIVPSPGTSGANKRTQVLFPNINGLGINLAPNVFFYFLQTATITNWANTSGNTPANHQIILPDQYVIVRQTGGATTTTNITLGQVPLYNWRIPLYGTNVPQDNFIGLPRPAIQTLNDLGFTNNNSGNGFLASPGTSGANRRDQLLVVDNTSQGINKAPIKFYFLLGAGNSWRATDNTGVDAGTNVVFQPGSAFIIRKFATNTTTVIWSEPPNYNNN